MTETNRVQWSLFTALIALLFAAGMEARGLSGEPIRFATFNIAMYRGAAGELADELASGDSEQAAKIAEIVQRVRPDVLLINELDYDDQHRAIASFQRNFLEVGQGGQEAIEFPYYFTAKVNTGVPSGRDLDKDGKLDEPGDRLGFGRYPGQYGMAVLSRFPIDEDKVRTFRNFLWKTMPNALLPAVDGEPFYDTEDLAILRLSSKSHWDVPVQCPDGVVHFLVSHPTPPVFDGPEDRNGSRNHDEIRLFADYVDPQESGYLVDDNGVSGGLARGELFVIAGDLNADPQDGQSLDEAAKQLTEHKLIQATPIPSSLGAVEAAKQQGQANTRHQGDPAHDTGDFSDRRVGNLRIDYVLPSIELKVLDSGVFWPEESEPGGDLVVASDHRLVWIDVAVAVPQ